MRVALWLHFAAVLVASAASGLFFCGLTGTLRYAHGIFPLQDLPKAVAATRFLPFFFPIPWLITGIWLSRQSAPSDSAFRIYSASCSLFIVCLFACLLLAATFTLSEL